MRENRSPEDGHVLLHVRLLASKQIQFLESLLEDPLAQLFFHSGGYQPVRNLKLLPS